MGYILKQINDLPYSVEVQTMESVQMDLPFGFYETHRPQPLYLPNGAIAPTSQGCPGDSLS